MAKSFVPWADLPRDVVYLIAQCFDTSIDVLHFRAVCNSWRISTPIPKKSSSLPKQMHLPINVSTNPNVPATPTMVPSTLFQTTVFRLEEPESSPKKSWLIKVSEPVEGRFRLMNPFSSRPVNNPPDDLLPKVLNFLNLRISQVSRHLFLRNDGRDDIDRDSRPCFKADLSTDFDSSRKFLAIEDASLRSVKVGDNFWSMVDRHDEYTDLTNYKKEFFTVDRSGIVTVVDESSLMTIGLIPHSFPFDGEWYLVKSCGYLYLVGRDLHLCNEETFYPLGVPCFIKHRSVGRIPVEFKVYKLDDSNRINKKWEEVTDLGDQIFFVSRDCSYAVSARDFADCIGNRIIFVDEIRSQYDNQAYVDDGTVLGGLEGGRVGVYNLEDGNSGPLTSFPAYLNMFWPPPNWLRSNSASSSSTG